MEEEYELIPLSPVRKLEKRIDKIESSGLNSELVKELVNISKTNQRVVEDLTKINSEMITKVSDLSVSVNNLINKIENFMSRIELPKEPEEEGELEKTEEGDVSEGRKEKIKKLDRRIEKLEKRINALILYTMPKIKKHP